MRSSLTSNVVLVGLVAGLAYGCASPDPASGPDPFAKTGGAGGNSSGTGGTSSGTGGGNGGSGGGVDGTGGTSGSGGTTGTGGTSGTGGTAGAGGVDGGPRPDGGGVDGPVVVPSGDITKVVPTAGCGKAPGPGAMGGGTIMTMGTKPAGCADSRCGAWAYTRNYNVYLPAGYNNMKAYPLLFQGGGCGAGATSVYPLPMVSGEIIRVGIAPPPNQIGHATNPNQGCFDDKEGDDSVDWVFYENLYDRLADLLCFDKNRVMASGNSSGAWFSNEVGCKYAGADRYPIRAVMPNTGGLPTDPRYVPTCTTKPMAGMWVHEVGDSENPFAGNKVAIARAMNVNKCTMGTNFDNAAKEPYAIPGVGANTCKKILGCPELYPLVVCDLPGNAHGSHDNVTNPGFATFIKMFSMGPFLTQ